MAMMTDILTMSNGLSQVAKESLSRQFVQNRGVINMVHNFNAIALIVLDVIGWV